MNNLGCIFLENGINFDLDKVTDCCILHNDGRGLPILIENYNGEPIDWNNLFDKKAKRVEAQKEKTIYDCEGCYHLGEYSFTGERKISEFHFSQCRICNAKCVYCSQYNHSYKLNYNPYPIIKDLIEKGYYKAGGEATLQGGEPTVMPNFDELVQLFLENGTSVRVHTSGIRYSDKVNDALKQKKGTVVISLDSGCSNTYNRIKRVDRFEEVVENIKKYSASDVDNVIIKYIIVPGYNDNIDEIDKFFKLMNKLNVKNLALDMEIQYAMKYNYKDVSEHIFMLIDYFYYTAKQLNLNVITYSFLSYLLKNRTTPKKETFGNKFLYKFYVNSKKDKSKEIKYNH